ncbi:protein TIFY 5A-like [Rhodamnia argentea]|uniref:Protein TIFY n=1 Tax=Rhodamnia argentea TaxID=178133 RepID=A0A8B8R1Q8_9MYRT|nr:protein TIFY 5A-like [Rhodamnia argentea]
MRRNCNLQFSLQSASASLSSVDFRHPDHHPDQMEGSSGRQEEQQQLTIFYNGDVCVSDVTELQARAILVFASREMQQRMTATVAVTDPQQPNSPSRRPPPAELHSPTDTGLSMKRSLQRFLQKRKLRYRATSPYHMDQ